MSLRHSPDGTSRAVLQACAKAIRALEPVTGSLKEHDITADDANSFNAAMHGLWSIIETNGYTIDVDMITDTLHFIRQKGIDADAVLRMATGHFETGKGRC